MSRLKSPRRNKPAAHMCALIVEALRQLGGEAHRRQVIEHILAGASPATDREALRCAVLAAFDAAAGDPDQPGVPFGRRFGPGSHRWMLGRAEPPEPQRIEKT